MKLVVISPEYDDPREMAVLGGLLSAGLERYHVRKPHWTAVRLEAWLRSLPLDWRSRLVLHQYHEFVGTFGLAGYHWRDRKRTKKRRGVPAVRWGGLAPRSSREGDNARRLPIASRSCHDLKGLRTTLGRYDSVFFGPVFPSISKPGYGPRNDVSIGEVSSLLARRTAQERRTTVIALGGVRLERLADCRKLGFDGVALFGAIWRADDPIAAFGEIQSAAEREGGADRGKGGIEISPSEPPSAPPNRRRFVLPRFRVSLVGSPGRRGLDEGGAKAGTSAQETARAT
ncbi:MAG: thiamine phosphate synthase [Opitutaceae bacterium]|jgi:thiamine-phosphate pyrophosphorylase